jgi:ATP-binding cassette subfamily B protein
LNNFSLEIKQGETIALVGPSGAGKTTMIKLLLRFYDPQQGRIMLGNTDIRLASLKQLRSAYALAAQDSMIFSASILDNIRYGRPKATYAEIEAAAEAAAALHFVERLPKKFETYIGEKGVTLSGGQKQRIVIARAILKKPEILLLDEATSSLDAENELLVKKSITKLMQGHITIIISHRLATIKQADRIVVMNNGGIESIGKHSSLILQSPAYIKLAKLQLQT